jgi:AcrR family transcriptional regulator
MGRPPKDETRKDTKALILEEASKLFADRGFDATGIDEISKKVGITKSVIYYHFKNKDEILQTLFDQYYKRAIEIKTTFGRDYIKSGGNSIMAYLDQVKRFFDESHTRVLKIALMESLKHNDKFPLLELINRIIGDAIEVFKDNVASDFREMGHEGFAGLFFMITFPLLGYLVLGEKYCQFTGMDRKDLEKKVFSEFATYFEQIVKERMLKL